MTDDALNGRLFLVDGNSLAYRAYFALPETIATSEGFPTNALYGFASMLLKVLAEFAPAHVVVAWDARERTFRTRTTRSTRPIAGRLPTCCSSSGPTSTSWSRPSVSEPYEGGLRGG